MFNKYFYFLVITVCMLNLMSSSISDAGQNSIPYSCMNLPAATDSAATYETVNDLVTELGVPLDSSRLSRLLAAYRNDFTSFQNGQLAPGCFSYALRSTWLSYVWSAYFIFWSWDSAYHNNSAPCTIMYGLSSLVSLNLGLAEWAGYRICEAEYMQADQSEIDLLVEDRQFMLLNAALLLPAIIAGSTQCKLPLVRFLFPYFFWDDISYRDWDDYYDYWD